MFRKQGFRRFKKYKKIACSFCTQKTTPDYKEASLLRNFVSERGKIMGRERTGVCLKHQRFLALAIKRARFLALLPFINRI